MDHDIDLHSFGVELATWQIYCFPFPIFIVNDGRVWNL